MPFDQGQLRTMLSLLTGFWAHCSLKSGIRARASAKNSAKNTSAASGVSSAAKLTGPSFGKKRVIVKLPSGLGKPISM